MKAARRRLLQYAFTALAWAATSCHRTARSSDGSNGAQRVVSLSPSTTEILFAVGAGKRVVGRTQFCDFPPEVSALPVVGGFVDANLEEIMRLSPDLVVGARGPAGPALVQKLESLGVATFFPKAQSIAEIEAAILDVAAKVGATEQGQAVVASMRARQHAVAAAVSAEPRVRALLVFGLSPIVVAGPESFPSEMLALANGENVVKSGGAYPVINAETLVTLDPEVVINGAAAGQGGEHRGIEREAPGWRELRAVRAGRVVPLTDEAALRSGPRAAEGIATVARILHPRADIPAGPMAR
jgi:iron complex transport system substrate-binding protein